jgi:CNT family concentrative nucleoside transporter
VAVPASLLADAQAVLGLGLFVALAVPFSSNWRRIRVSLVLRAIAVQFALCWLLLRVPVMTQALAVLNHGVTALAGAARRGSAFVFGYVGGAAPPFTVTAPEALTSFAFQVLPLIIVVSALSALLWHWRILPLLIRGLAWFFAHAVGTRGPTGLAITANVFLGQVEAPLLVKPYIAGMSRHELLLLMTAGMAMIAGTMMVVYPALLAPLLPDALSHLITKSLMSVPAAVLYAHLLLPEAEPGDAPAPPGRLYSSTIDAIIRGTQDGLAIWLNVLATLLVLVALVALADAAIGLVPGPGNSPLTLERAAGWLFAPFAWLMGIGWGEAVVAGRLLGVKTVLNEFLAYLDLVRLGAGALSPRATLITVYALCGFANFASMGIQVAGLTTMAPERRADLNALAWRSLLGATLASCMTGAIAGIVAF